MIRYIKGSFFPDAGGAVVETEAGIGYYVSLASNSPMYSYQEGEEVKVYIYMGVKEDDISLYGFSDMEERELFTLLIKVNGVGNKSGMSIMSIAPVNGIKKAIVEEDIKTLCKADGIGKKTAQRIVIDLRDKVDYVETEATEDASDNMGVGSDQKERQIAVMALVSLGYTNKEAEDAVSKVEDSDLSSEEYIRKALIYMM